MSADRARDSASGASLDTCEEIEANTTKNKGKRKANDQGGRRKEPKMQNRVFTYTEKMRIAECDLERVKSYVIDKVGSELFSDSFPERERLWVELRGAPLDSIIEEASQRYMLCTHS